MKKYLVTLKDGKVSVIVEAKKVTVKPGNTLVFYNPKESLTDQYLNGSDIVAVFQGTGYSYFTEYKEGI